MSYPLRPAKGAALRQHIVVTRFESGARPGPKPMALNIPAIRKLLRTEMTLPEIAAQMGVGTVTLRNFIKRRNICDLGARFEFISLQKSLRKVDA